MFNPQLPLRLRLASLASLCLCAFPLLATEDDAADQGAVDGVLVNFGKTFVDILPDGAKTTCRYDLADDFVQGDEQIGKQIFPDNRVEVTVETKAGRSQYVGIKKLKSPADQGEVTGQVEWTNNWTVVVKPDKGLTDGYGPVWPTPADMTATLKDIQVGDIVSLTFTTDHERHRIHTIEVKQKASAK